MKKSIIFDVDGTLWDSAQVVAESWNMVLSRHPETKDIHVTKEDMYRYMGHTMYEISCRMIPECVDALRAFIMQECMDNEDRYLTDHSGTFYPALKETLESLRADCSLYIVSNCQDGYIQTMMRDGGLEALIDDFECYGRTGREKGDNIRLLMERNGICSEDAVYVGDTAMDEAAAAAAGIPFIHAAYGFGEAKHPAAELTEIRKLPEVSREIFAAGQSLRR